MLKTNEVKILIIKDVHSVQDILDVIEFYILLRTGITVKIIDPFLQLASAYPHLPINHPFIVMNALSIHEKLMFLFEKAVLEIYENEKD